MRTGAKTILTAAVLAVFITAAAAVAQDTKPEAAPAVMAANGQYCKVAFVNLAKVLKESKEGQNLHQALDAEREKALAPLKTRQAEIDQIETQISRLQQEMLQKAPVWDMNTRNMKQIELQQLQLKYQGVIQSIQSDKQKIQGELSDKKNEMLQPLENKLNQIMERVGAEGGYCLILDTSPPMPQMPNFNPILFRDPALDITDKIIEEVDKK